MSYDYLVLTETIEDSPIDWFPLGVSPSGRYVICDTGGSFQKYWMLDRQTDSVTLHVNLSEYAFMNGAAVDDDDGTVYFTAPSDPSAVYHWTDLSVSPSTTALYEVPHSSSTISGSLRLCIMPDDSKKLAWLLGDNQDIADELIYTYDIATDTGTGITWAYTVAPMGISQDSYGDVWVFGRANDGYVVFKRIIDGSAGSAADLNVTEIPKAVDDLSVGEVQVVHTSAGWLVCADHGRKLYLLDDSDFSILAERDYATTGSGMVEFGSGAGRPLFLMVQPGLDEVWLPGPESFDNWIATGTVTDLCRISAADLTTLETRDAHDWTVDDVPDRYSPPMMYSSYDPKALISTSYDFAGTGPSIANYTPVIRYIGDAPAPGDSGDPTLRSWGFSLDGHDFYCLRVGDSETLVYDLTTGQWATWRSFGRDNWRAIVGQNWVGASSTTVAHGFGTDIVAGDDTAGVLWILDPSAGRDDTTAGGTEQFTRIVTGGVTLTGRQTVPCGAVTLSLNLGDPAMTGAAITLRTSDDQGNSWTDHGAITITADDFDQVVEWRALGLIRAPGRVFEFSDNGAAVRIGSADMR